MDWITPTMDFVAGDNAYLYAEHLLTPLYGL
jgi:hypothetical protein